MVVIVAFVFLERAWVHDERLSLNRWNMYRLLLASLFVSFKYVDERTVGLGVFASAGGLSSVTEMALLERVRLEILDRRLLVTVKQLYREEKWILSYYARHMRDAPEAPPSLALLPAAVGRGAVGRGSCSGGGAAGGGAPPAGAPASGSPPAAGEGGDGPAEATPENAGGDAPGGGGAGGAGPGRGDAMDLE